MKALACYVFAGAMIEGMKQAGIETVAQFERDKFGVPTSIANHGVPVYINSPMEWPWEEYEDADIVYGNPPCSAFSTASAGATGNDWREDRIGCTFHLWRAIQETNAKVVATESVPQILTTGADIVRELVRRANAYGYSVTIWKHNTVLFGMAQRRKRVYIIAHKTRLAIPTYTGPFKNVGDVLAGVDDPGTVAEIRVHLEKSYLDTPPGGKARAVYFDKYAGDETQRAPSFLANRLDENGISGVIPPDPAKIIHPNGNRLLGVREMLALHGYPPEWILAESTNGKDWSVAGKASMPPAARALGLAIQAGMDDEPLAFTSNMVIDQFPRKAKNDIPRERRYFYDDPAS